MAGVSELLPYMLHGTGDLFTSALPQLCVVRIADAVEFAREFVCESMEDTREQPNFELRGVSFETKLGLIAQLLQGSMARKQTASVKPYTSAEINHDSLP